MEDEQSNFKINENSLTKYGLEQTYHRGLGIMSRYHDFLKDVQLNQIRVRASNTTRTILSAYSQLLGMFGTNKCRSVMEQFTRFDKTKEVNSLKDMDVDVGICLKSYLTKVEVHKTGDSRFQMLEKD